MAQWSPSPSGTALPFPASPHADRRTLGPGPTTPCSPGSPHARQFRLRFLAQCSAVTLTPREGRWEVREGGSVQLWEQLERVLSAYDEAGQPGPETFTLYVYDGGQHLRHPQLPGLPLTLGGP